MIELIVVTIVLSCEEIELLVLYLLANVVKKNKVAILGRCFVLAFLVVFWGREGLVGGGRGQCVGNSRKTKKLQSFGEQMIGVSLGWSH